MTETTPQAVPHHQIQYVPAKPMIFFIGINAGLGGVIVSTFLIGDFVGPLAVALTAIGVGEITRIFFARHRDISWSPDGDPKAATTELVMNLVITMIGIMAAFMLFATRLRTDDLRSLFTLQYGGVMILRLEPLQFNDEFANSMMTGLVISGISFLLAAIYKEGGMALTTAWVGSVWGIATLLMWRLKGGDIDIINVLLLSGSLICISVGFLTAGTIGLFLSRAAMKYGPTSGNFRRVASTSMLLLGGAIGFILFAAVLSAMAAQRSWTDSAPRAEAPIGPTFQ